MRRAALDRDQGEQRRASLRASDADREQFVEALRQHHAEGRLTVEELTERTERAYAAGPSAISTPWPPTCRPSGHRPRRPGNRRPRMRPSGPKRAEAKVDLIRTVLWFGLLSIVLTAIWAMTDIGGCFWPIWPMIGFMLAIAGQLFYVYGPARPDDDRPGDR